MTLQAHSSPCITSLPTATPGGRAVTVRNPDGSSNEKQSPPPLIFLEAPTPVAKPVVVHSVTPPKMEIGGPDGKSFGLGMLREDGGTDERQM